MNTNFYTEDGNYLDFEDLTSLVKFMVSDLLEQNYSDNEITKFDDNEIWQRIAKNVIIALNNEHETNLPNN